MQEEPGKRAQDELNIRVLWSLAAYLRERCAPEVLARAAAAAGLAIADLGAGARWISCEQAEAFLAAARPAFSDDEALRDACAHKYAEGYGPLLLLMRAFSPWTAFVVSGKYMGSMVNRVGRFEYERSGARCTIRYRSDRTESRLLCLLRMGQIMAVPTLWGLPRLRIEHPSCVARGDACCEYVFRLVEPVRWLPAVAGLAAGFALLAALRLAGVALSPWSLVLPVVAVLCGAGWEWRRASRANLALALDTQDGLADLAHADAEARQEILAFEQRQRQWHRLLDEQIAERTSGQQRVIDEIRCLETRRVEVLRAFSHDLKNPLSVLSTSAFTLRRATGVTGEGTVLDDITSASKEMGHLLAELMATLSRDADALELTAREVTVSELVDKLRRRLDALCRGRIVRASTSCAKDAPSTIVIDPLVFDRVTDNLLSNAVKYTERGSIRVEVGATSDFLTVGVIDTGRGIAEDVIQQIFEPGGSDPKSRAPDSYGLGLSVVVQLLARVGGRLDVMSRLGAGSTFCAQFPLTPTGTVPAHHVVTIR